MLTTAQLATIQSTGANLNWLAGWILISLCFLSGAIMGLGFHREDYMGGYNSFRRRLARLGHIAFAALGVLNILYALRPVPPPGTLANIADPASLLFIIGGIAMPVVCFLTAWRKPFRHLFFIPVLALVGAVGFTIYGGVIAL